MEFGSDMKGELVTVSRLSYKTNSINAPTHVVAQVYASTSQRDKLHYDP